MEEGKVRKIVTILLRFYHRNALIHDQLKLNERKEMATLGVLEVEFNEYIQKQLVCKLSIKSDDLNAKVHAANAVKYAFKQLHKTYQDIEDLQVYCDGNLIPKEEQQSYLKIKDDEQH